MIPVIYGELCPQCYDKLSWEEIENNLCENTGKDLSRTKESEIYEEFEKFFVEKFGSKPRAIQRMWARRVLAGQSFAAIAPTGIGKTSFGIVMSMFLARKGKKSYLLVPTTIILKDMVKKFEDLGEDIAFYHSKMKGEEKKGMENRIKEGKFNILITTTAYLARNHKNLYGKFFHFIFVDDVDSLLKRSKNLEKVLKILHKKGVLMVSTATGTKGYNTKILRDKLGFDVGNMRNAVRNIEDIYASKDALKDILNAMGSGALIFAPSAKEAKTLADRIGDKAGLVIEKDKRAYDDFQAGKLDYLVGVSTPYGSLIRGIDMPERIRYVVFYGIPRFKINAENLDDFGDKLMLSLAYGLRDYGFDEYIKNRNVKAIREKLKSILQNRKDLRGEGFIYKDGYIIFPDVKTYIQGSGRASRLYAGGITKGASFLLDGDDMVEIFVQRAELYGIEFKSLEDVDIESLKREIDRDRRRIAEKVEEKDVITPSLFIVESPNKAKHIAHFFGKPNLRIIGNAVVYEVAVGDRVLTIAPSLGHTVDLSTTQGYYGVVIKTGLFIPFYSPIRKCRDCGYQFTEGDKCPICGSEDIYNAREQIEILRRLAYECEDVIIGTDPDTEGEKIAWDLRNLLSPFAKSIKRAEFHEVTKDAIIKAIRESREFDENLVKAQIVRRIEDRWIGFELSHILWNVFGKKNLSAGRAQTPVLGWIIERYEKSKEIREEYFIKGTDVKSPWKENVLAKVEKIGDEVKDYVVSPYTTDEILKDANTILGLGAREAMNILQDLFESGLITYHRTDSTHVSQEGMSIAKKYLGEDFRPRRWGKEGAHECIRPTKPWSAEDIRRFVNEGILNLEIQDEALRVYDLIFRRFMASESVGKIRISKYKVSAKGKVLEIPLIVEAYGKSVELYPYRIKIYRPLPTGMVRIEAEKRKIKLAPYTQADVIRLMKDRKIGRPSTYATIISKLFKRDYIVERSGKLIPTRIGIEVYSFLSTNYGKFVSEERTRILERKMEDVENGNRDYLYVLNELYEEIGKIRGN